MNQKKQINTSQFNSTQTFDLDFNNIEEIDFGNQEIGPWQSQAINSDSYFQGICQQQKNPNHCYERTYLMSSKNKLQTIQTEIAGKSPQQRLFSSLRKTTEHFFSDRERKGNVKERDINRMRVQSSYKSTQQNICWDSKKKRIVSQYKIGSQTETYPFHQSREMSQSRLSIHPTTLPNQYQEFELKQQPNSSVHLEYLTPITSKSVQNSTQMISNSHIKQMESSVQLTLEDSNDDNNLPYERIPQMTVLTKQSQVGHFLQLPKQDSSLNKMRRPTSFFNQKQEMSSNIYKSVHYNSSNMINQDKQQFSPQISFPFQNYQNSQIFFRLKSALVNNINLQRHCKQLKNKDKDNYLIEQKIKQGRQQCNFASMKKVRPSELQNALDFNLNNFKSMREDSLNVLQGVATNNRKKITCKDIFDGTTKKQRQQLKSKICGDSFLIK